MRWWDKAWSLGSFTCLALVNPLPPSQSFCRVLRSGEFLSPPFKVFPFLYSTSHVTLIHPLPLPKIPPSRCRRALEHHPIILAHSRDHRCDRSNLVCDTFRPAQAMAGDCKEARQGGHRGPQPPRARPR